MTTTAGRAVPVTDQGAATDVTGATGAATGTDERTGTATGPARRPGAAGGGRERLLGLGALGMTLAPFLVAAVALVVTVGGDYAPSSDHALTELQVRDVGRHETLVGLYSRGDWNHPGPAEFLVLAPFYRATGGMSISLGLGALAVNGAAVAGMGLVARRRGGLPLMLLTLLGCGLLMRSLGADFLQDPWNCFVTVLPFGTLIYLSWSMWQRDAWAVPVGVGVASFLAQAHVGFLALALPLVAWGVLGYAVATVCDPDREGRRASVVRGRRAAAIGAGVAAVAWLPTLVDTVRHEPSNAGSIYQWFRHPEEAGRTPAEGWRIVSAQFGGAPEWLVTKREFLLSGESPFTYSAPLPWLLLLVVAAAVVLWRRDDEGARSLVATVGVTLLVGVVAVSRTVGPLFDYRLRWTHVPAMIGAVLVAWAGWLVAADRWPRGATRVLTPAALAGVAVLGAVNSFTGATAGTPQNGDSDAMAAVNEQVLDAVDPGDRVLVTDAYHSGAWYARGLVLALEKHGYDVVVPAGVQDEYGRHRVVGDVDAVDTVLVVTMDDSVDVVEQNPDLEKIAGWSAMHPDARADLVAERDALLAGLTLDEVADVHATRDRLREIESRLDAGAATAYRVAVYVDTSHERG